MGRHGREAGVLNIGAARPQQVFHLLVPVDRRVDHLLDAIVQVAVLQRAPESERVYECEELEG